MQNTGHLHGRNSGTTQSSQWSGIHASHCGGHPLLHGQHSKRGFFNRRRRPFSLTAAGCSVFRYRLLFIYMKSSTSTAILPTSGSDFLEHEKIRDFTFEAKRLQMLHICFTQPHFFSSFFFLCFLYFVLSFDFLTSSLLFFLIYLFSSSYIYFIFQFSLFCFCFCFFCFFGCMFLLSSYYLFLSLFHFSSFFFFWLFLLSIHVLILFFVLSFFLSLFLFTFFQLFPVLNFFFSFIVFFLTFFILFLYVTQIFWLLHSFPSHSKTHTYTHTHTLPLSFSLTLSLYLSFSLSWFSFPIYLFPLLILSLHLLFLYIFLSFLPLVHSFSSP